MGAKYLAAISALERYRALKNQAEVLAYELHHPIFVSSGEIIECLSFPGKTSESTRKTTWHSNKTPEIATKYEELAKQMNDETYLQILREYYLVFIELERIELYVRQLDSELGELIRLHYFEGVGWEDIQTRLNISRRKMFRMREDALSDIERKFHLIHSMSRA